MRLNKELGQGGKRSRSLFVGTDTHQTLWLRRSRVQICPRHWRQPKLHVSQPGRHYAMAACQHERSETNVLLHVLCCAVSVKTILQSSKGTRDVFWRLCQCTACCVAFKKIIDVLGGVLKPTTSSSNDKRKKELQDASWRVFDEDVGVATCKAFKASPGEQRTFTNKGSDFMWSTTPFTIKGAATSNVTVSVAAVGGVNTSVFVPARGRRTPWSPPTPTARRSRRRLRSQAA